MDQADEVLSYIRRACASAIRTAIRPWEALTDHVLLLVPRYQNVRNASLSVFVGIGGCPSRHRAVLTLGQRLLRGSTNTGASAQ